MCHIVDSHTIDNTVPHIMTALVRGVMRSGSEYITMVFTDRQTEK